MAQLSDKETTSEDLFAKLADEGPVSADKLLKEDEILSEQDKLKPDTAACNPAGGEQEKKPKKPCANCSCGLADELEKEAKEKISEASATDSKTTTEATGAQKSSCGSCYLGDAFRCASCPYRGMPAFKPGEKVTIDVHADDAI